MAQPQIVDEQIIRFCGLRSQHQEVAETEKTRLQYRYR